jgi:hypothetical protein
LQTFITGSPIVFHTAPPQPASNALQTWYALFDGGADASQKGFGDLMPAQFVARLIMLVPFSVQGSRFRFEVWGLGFGVLPPNHRVNPLRRALPIRRGVHHFLAAVDAIAACEIFRVARLHRIGIHPHHAGLGFEVWDLG